MNFFKRLFQSNQATHLPPDVESVIDSITVNIREHGDPELGNESRVLVFGLVGGPFEGNYQSIKRRIERVFPELNDAQVARAVRWVQSEITNQLRVTRPTERKRSGWVHNW